MLHGRLGWGTSPATPAIRSGRHRWYGPWTCARTPHPGTASSSCCPGQGQPHPRGSSTFPRPNPARTGSAWARSQTTSTLPPPMPRPSAAVARARPDPASSTIPVASHGRPGRQRVRQQRAAGTRRSAMPATNGRHGARSENQVPRTERWATPSDSRRVLAWLRPGASPCCAWPFQHPQRGGCVATPGCLTLDCRDSLARPGDSHRGPFCFCGQQTRLGRRP